MLFAFALINNSMAQGFLKKLKDKAAKVLDKSPDNSNNKTPESNVKKQAEWCDAGAGSGYTLAYSGADNFTIVYEESCLGMGREGEDYRIILKQRVGNEMQFVVIDNGKVTATTKELSKEQLLCGIRQPYSGSNATKNKEDYEKYFIAEKTTTVVPNQKAQTVTTPKSIDPNKVNMGYEMMKNTDKYKNLSPKEKKEMDSIMKLMPQFADEYNKSGIGGKTFSTPEVKGGTYTFPSGYYSIVVKGKNYGRFIGQPFLAVSNDENNVYIVAPDAKGKTMFIANDKKISLDANNTQGAIHIGEIVMSKDGKKAAFIETKPMSEKEQDDMLKIMQGGGDFKQQYIITKSDGTHFMITPSGGGSGIRVANTGEVIYVNELTGEVFADGKQIGKFNTSGSGDFNVSALLFGNDLSKTCYYSSDGSLNYLDGTKKDMGILFPEVTSKNGKSYITWFRKCKNEIYLGKYEF